MTSVTFDQLLERAVEFEKQLERYYARIRDEAEDGGVRLLTYYLSRHRRHLEKALSGFEPEQIENIRKIRLKYDVPFHPEKDFQFMETPHRQVKGRELLESAVGYDTQLVSLYRSILNQPLSREAESLVESLIRLEEKDIVMLKKMIAMDYF